MMINKIKKMKILVEKFGNYYLRTNLTIFNYIQEPKVFRLTNKIRPLKKTLSWIFKSF